MQLIATPAKDLLDDLTNWNGQKVSKGAIHGLIGGWSLFARAANGLKTEATFLNTCTVAREDPVQQLTSI